MTVDTTGGSAVEPWNSEEFGDVGLEDVGVGDVVIPRLSIVHDEAVFKNNLTGETHDTLTVVLLGLVKQRIFWADDIDEGDKPLCKSPDFAHGFPQMRTDIPADKQFPWAESNFDPANFPAEKGINGHVTLPCDSCVFAQWGKDSAGKNTPPPCNEQHTYPLLIVGEDGETQPALLTVQKTGIKPSRTYISGFASSKTPFFTQYTQLSLDLQKRGSVKFSVPQFRRAGGTDRAWWAEYADQFRSIRSFIREAPRPAEGTEDAEPAPSNNENTAPAAPPTPPKAPAAPPKAPTPPSPPKVAAPAAPAPAEAPAESASSDDDDDLPF